MTDNEASRLSFRSCRSSEEAWAWSGSSISILLLGSRNARHSTRSCCPKNTWLWISAVFSSQHSLHFGHFGIPWWIPSRRLETYLASNMLGFVSRRQQSFGSTFPLFLSKVFCSSFWYSCLGIRRPSLSRNFMYFNFGFAGVWGLSIHFQLSSKVFFLSTYLFFDRNVKVFHFLCPAFSLLP
jgi:hypothetical protein